MPKVLISDRLSPAALQIFQDRGIEFDARNEMSPDELKTVIGQYDALVVRSPTKVTAEVLELGTNLKVVGRAGVTVENIDLAAADQKGVLVMNTPFVASLPMAEHAIAMMFALARKIPQANASTHRGEWDRHRFYGVELAGKVLGIIGCGNVGALVAERALALHMRVVCFDPFLNSARAKDLGIEKTELDVVLAQADFLSLHINETAATRKMINADTIARMKTGVRIINCARGSLVDEADLRAAIESGHVAGAALDVFSVEPARENPVFGLEQVVCTPHLGASTTENLEIAAMQIAEQISDYLLLGVINNARNMPTVTREEAPRLNPYRKLASQLGSFAGQLTEHPILSVKIDYEGAVAELNTRPLTAMVLESLLAPLGISANVINAREVAKARGIEVIESCNVQEGNYHTLIRVTVTTEARTRGVAGTLFAGHLPRVVEVKGIPIEAELGEHMMYVVNSDQPGFIGALGTLLGNHNINIATFHLGRNEAGGEAILLTQVDQPLTDDILADVRKLKQVKQAKPLSF